MSRAHHIELAHEGALFIGKATTRTNGAGLCAPVIHRSVPGKETIISERLGADASEEHRWAMLVSYWWTEYTQHADDHLDDWRKGMHGNVCVPVFNDHSDVVADVELMPVLHALEPDGDGHLVRLPKEYFTAMWCVVCTANPLMEDEEVAMPEKWKADGWIPGQSRVSAPMLRYNALQFAGWLIRRPFAESAPLGLSLINLSGEDK